MELNDIWARVGDREVFQGLSLRSSARLLGVIGPNGAGKSSLLRLLQGLLKAHRGQLEIEEPAGLVFQNPDHQLLFPTVMEELTFGLTQRGSSLETARQEAQRLAHRYGAQRLLTMASHELSAGQKTLVCLLAVLMDQPKTILLDESFANLDLVTARQMTHLIRSTQLKVVFSTHQLHLLHDFEEVIWLDQGQVQLQGPPSRVLPAYEDWAKGQLGSPC